jgi:hypothetical protein
MAMPNLNKGIIIVGKVHIVKQNRLKNRYIIVNSVIENIMNNIKSYIESHDIEDIIINIILVYHDARKACLYYDIVLNPDLIKLINDINLYIIDDEKSFYITKDKDLVLPTNPQETGQLLGYINCDDTNRNNYKLDRYMYKIRAINKDGCSSEFYAEVGSNLKKDEFICKYNEFDTILNKYNIDTFCYIEKIRKNVIKLEYFPPCNDYNFLTGLLYGFVISYGLILFNVLNRKK